MGCHPVAVVQYTFTHKQYIERHKTNNAQNNTILEECGPCPVFAGFTLEFALQLRKKARKNLSQGSHKHTMRIHSHNNKNTYITLSNKSKPIYTLIKIEPKNIKECDNSTRKIHISSNFILSISLLLTFDTLLLRPSLHCNTPLRF